MRWYLVTSDTSWLTTLGLVSIAIILTLKYIPKTKFVPSALLVVVIATPITYALHLDKKGMLIIGDIPKGLPPGIRDFLPSYFWLLVQAIQFGSWSQVSGILPNVILLSIISYLDAVSIGRVFALQNKYEIGVNNELIALGIGNMMGGLI